MYKEFAQIYDKLVYDVDYVKWADYIEEIFKRNGKKPSLILDLGCGTGSFCVEMAGRGYDMIGLDLSTDMLAIAKEKSAGFGDRILLINQDMISFELYGTVDVIVCLLDSINYITTKKSLKKILRHVKNYLNPEGLFIFDINTCHKFENILDGNVFYEDSESITYVWDNHYDNRRKICEFNLTFFLKRGEYYQKFEEIHYERAYTEAEMSRIIREQGLKLLNIYHNLSFLPARKKSERIFFVCSNA